jgi:hypothetical protein
MWNFALDQCDALAMHMVMQKLGLPCQSASPTEYYSCTVASGNCRTPKEDPSLFGGPKVMGEALSRCSGVELCGYDKGRRGGKLDALTTFEQQSKIVVKENAARE